MKSVAYLAFSLLAFAGFTAVEVQAASRVQNEVEASDSFADCWRCNGSACTQDCDELQDRAGRGACTPGGGVSFCVLQGSACTIPKCSAGE